MVTACRIDLTELSFSSAQYNQNLQVTDDCVTNTIDVRFLTTKCIKVTFNKVTIVLIQDTQLRQQHDCLFVLLTRINTDCCDERKTVGGDKSV